MRWSYLLLLFCFACQSKPVQVPEAPKPASGKVTLEAPPAPAVQFFVKVAYAPRRVAEVDSALALNVSVQNCFRTAGSAVADVSGKITYAGALEAIRIKTEQKELSSCLESALAAVSVGRGKIGPFKARISTDPNGAPGAKGLNLGTPEAKKFE